MTGNRECEASQAGVGPPSRKTAQNAKSIERRNTSVANALPEIGTDRAAEPAGPSSIPLAGRGEGGTRKKAQNRNSIEGRKPHGNSRLAKIGIPELRVKRRPGAPKGNRNAWKTGLHTGEIKALRRRLRAWRHRVRDTLADVDAMLDAQRRQEAAPQAKLTARPLPHGALDVSE